MGHRAIIAGGGTGGHLYPALNLAEALRRRAGTELEILFIGAQRGIEARVLPEKGVAHELLPLEPIYRSRPWRNWRLVSSAIRSGREIRRIFETFAPDLVVGTGGYAAGPVVGWAALRRLPTAIQEQNSYPGLTTRWLAPYVDQLHLGYAEALRELQPGPDTEVRIHGNPIRWPEREIDRESARRELGLGPGRVVLVTGGSQGAAALNAALLAALEAVGRGQLPPWPADAEMLWSTGPANHSRVSKRLSAIGGSFAIRAVPFISEMDKALAVSTLAVSRAGAQALSELCAWGIPALLVPYPHAAADHQRRNARVLERLGGALVIEERELGRDPAILWRAVLDLLSGPERLAKMARASRARGNPRAADQIATDLLRLVGDR